MPAKILVEDKKCEECGKKFNRRVSKSGILEAIEEFKGRKFCSRPCYFKHNTGKNHWLWKGGVKKNSDGYLRDSKTDQYVHRKTVERFIGRKLRKDEVIHHINGDVTDNRIENLQILTNSHHRKLHCRSQRRNKSGIFSA